MTLTFIPFDRPDPPLLSTDLIHLFPVLVDLSAQIPPFYDVVALQSTFPPPKLRTLFLGRSAVTYMTPWGFQQLYCTVYMPSKLNKLI